MPFKLTSSPVGVIDIIVVQGNGVVEGEPRQQGGGRLLGRGGCVWRTRERLQATQRSGSLWLCEGIATLSRQISSRSMASLRTRP